MSGCRLSLDAVHVGKTRPTLFVVFENQIAAGKRANMSRTLISAPSSSRT